MIKEIYNFNHYISRNIYIEFQEAHVSLTINYICVIFNSVISNILQHIFSGGNHILFLSTFVSVGVP